MVLTVPVFSLGFDFAEAELDPSLNGIFIDSTFVVNLLAGTTVVDSFTFSRPNDIATFVGIWSTVAFSKVEIRESTGSIGNEFFGEFYTGHTSPSAIPAAAAMPLFLSGLAGLAVAVRRRRTIAHTL